MQVKNFSIMLNNLLQIHLKQVRKEQFRKTAETTADWIGNKISDAVARSYGNKITAFELPSNPEAEEKSIEILEERCISPEKIQQINDEMRLI